MNKLSLIISVYNKPEILELVLTSLLLQTFKEFEVIIADDGSSEDIKSVINKFKSELDIKHVYQKKEGFRKNKILNEAIRKSASDYLVFTDGDCIPHKDFLKEHFRNRADKRVLCGKRVMLSKTLSKKITMDKIINGSFEKQTIKRLLDSLKVSENTKYAEEGLIIKNKLIRKIFLPGNGKLAGSNFSLHKKLIEKINGFDENYIGAGIGEDSDIEFRLGLINAELSSLRNLAILFHVWHKSTVESDSNYKYFEEVKKRKEYFCRMGLDRIEN